MLGEISSPPQNPGNLLLLKHICRSYSFRLTSSWEKMRHLLHSVCVFVPLFPSAGLSTNQRASLASAGFVSVLIYMYFMSSEFKNSSTHFYFTYMHMILCDIVQSIYLHSLVKTFLGWETTWHIQILLMCLAWWTFTCLTLFSIRDGYWELSRKQNAAVIIFILNYCVRELQIKVCIHPSLNGRLIHL